MPVLQLQSAPAYAPENMITVGTIMVATGCADEVAVVHIAGAVDMTTVPVVKAELMRAVTGEAVAVIVDLNSVNFFSCAGLQMLVETRDMARACQVGICLAARGRVVLRPLEITGLLDVFLVHPSVSTALAAMSPPVLLGGGDRAASDRPTCEVRGKSAQRVDRELTAGPRLAAVEDDA
jgi:anti-sigma B factor antagonist